MKNICFRISDKEHELYDKKVKEKLGVSLPVFFKSVGVSFLIRDEDVKKSLYNNNINLDDLSEYYDTELKTYLTKEQYEALKKMADKHGWSLSKEIRFRLQNTLSYNLDFYDQELDEMQACRNQIKRIGININMILRRDEGRVLDKDGFKKDIDDLKNQLTDLESRFNYFLKQCRSRITSSKG
ncbi:TraY domain protein [Salmonella enterica]|nr:TraY domain protein [Salmonella enterica]